MKRERSPHSPLFPTLFAAFLTCLLASNIIAGRVQGSRASSFCMRRKLIQKRYPGKLVTDDLVGYLPFR
jgi:hypothetical protein